MTEGYFIWGTGHQGALVREDSDRSFLLCTEAKLVLRAHEERTISSKKNDVGRCVFSARWWTSSILLCAGPPSARREEDNLQDPRREEDKDIPRDELLLA